MTQMSTPDSLGSDAAAALAHAGNQPVGEPTASATPHRPSETLIPLRRSPSTGTAGHSDPHDSASHVSIAKLPPLPPLGKPEEWYADEAHAAEKRGDHLAHEAFKVGQYLTLALAPDLPWVQKLKYFRHALKRHCLAPEWADPMTKRWYERMAKLVRAHCGSEALRIVSHEDDCYNARIGMGQNPSTISDDAEAFFAQICPVGDRCPSHYNEEDWRQLRIFRDQWI